MKRLSILIIALFLIGGMAFAQKKEPGKVKTVVIDAGHGGDKPGAIGKKAKEKDLTLSMALKFGKLITDNYPDVNVIYTRKTDVDITLAERAHIANRNKADLFISIHANSHKTSQPTGVETFVMGLSQSKANMDVAKAENADILLEDGYKNNSDYQGFDPNSPESYVMFAMYQNAYLDRSLNFAHSIQKQYKTNLSTIDRGVKQAELFVLYKTAMPAVLTEVGFISNPTEEQFMMSDEGQAKIVVSLFNAFADYKAQIENTKRPASQKIDLPGYGKNKTQVKENKTAQDSANLAAKQLDDALAATIQEGDVAPVKPQKVVAQQKPAQNQEPDPDEWQGPQEKAPKVEIIYKVQFLVSDHQLADGAKEFKGMTGYSFYQQDGTYRYTMGNEPTVKRATLIQSEVRQKGFKDAFVVAFYNGKRISLQQAKALLEDDE